MDIVVFSTADKPIAGPKDKFTTVAAEKYIAAIMLGLKPAIEGDTAMTPEGGMRKLFLATCELLKNYIPKVGAHQRNIHGGGVYDEVSRHWVKCFRSSRANADLAGYDQPRARGGAEDVTMIQVTGYKETSVGVRCKCTVLHTRAKRQDHELK